MGRKRHTPEQIITALREAEVGLARGKSVKLMSREYVCSLTPSSRHTSLIAFPFAIPTSAFRRALMICPVEKFFRAAIVISSCLDPTRF